MKNVSFDGSTVQFHSDSPLLLWFDPGCLDWIRDLLASRPAEAPMDVGALLEQVNGHFPAMSCYQVTDFRPGEYSLDPRDIHKFGNEEDALNYDESQEDEMEATEDASSFPFVGVDSGALILADSAHLSKLVDLLSWDEYNLAMKDDMLFGRISEILGRAYFAVILGSCMPGMEFDGDGTYTMRADAIRPTGW